MVTRGRAVTQKRTGIVGGPDLSAYFVAGCAQVERYAGPEARDAFASALSRFGLSESAHEVSEIIGAFSEIAYHTGVMPERDIVASNDRGDAPDRIGTGNRVVIQLAQMVFEMAGNPESTHAVNVATGCIAELAVHGYGGHMLGRVVDILQKLSGDQAQFTLEADYICLLARGKGPNHKDVRSYIRKKFDAINKHLAGMARDSNSLDAT